jgi:hypothetical protein
MHTRLKIHCFMEMNIFAMSLRENPQLYQNILLCYLVLANQFSYNHSHLQHVLYHNNDTCFDTVHHYYTNLEQ